MSLPFLLFSILVTKAEDKIKNIKEAIQVFEDWLADLEKSKEEKEGGDKKKKEKAEKEKKPKDDDEVS